MKTAKVHGRMFHRRLTLLSAVMAGVLVLLAAQMFRLAVVQGAARYERAERRLDLVRFLPTTRGRILDRNGLTLAVDRPSYLVAVEYEVITGAWAFEQAAGRARSEDRAAWDAMSPPQRDAAVEKHLPGFEAEVQQVWSTIMTLGGLDRPGLDRRLDAIKKDVQTTAAIVWDRQLRRQIRFGRGDVDPATFRPRPIREQRQAHVVLPGVTDKVAFAFRRAAQHLPGLVVKDSHRRSYPWSEADVPLERAGLPRALRSSDPVTIRVEGVADHLLGGMRDEVWAQDIQRRPFRDPVTGVVDRGGYRVGDVVGTRGLERTFERRLRGERGVLRKRLDSGKEDRQEYARGEDLQITIDIVLQARIQAILAPGFGLTTVQQYQAGWNANGTPRETGLPLGTPLNSAVVVLDIENGDILAMVSMPTLAMGPLAPEPYHDDGRRWVNLNRPVQAVYPPGSIAKPLVMAAALTEGVHDVTVPIECTGHYLAERRDIARCWCYRPPSFITHGELVADEAIARSCNIYFYTMGERLGMTRLARWYRRFGVGRPLDVGLLYDVTAPDGTTSRRGESGGAVPSETLIERLRGRGELRFASVIMGIGQGPVSWTPLHAANAYAILARGGAVRDATLVRDRGRRNGPRRDDLPLDDTVVATVLEGMRRSVSEPLGTGHHITYPDGTREPIINVEGVTVWAKTGTAQATPAAFDIDRDGTPEVQLDNPSHAWFVGLVGAGAAGDARPRYAISVIVEYGGSGGRTSGPIANEIIRALQAQGYLPDDIT